MSLLVTLENIAQSAGITASRTNAKFGALHAFYAQSKQALDNANNLRQHACKGAFWAHRSGIAKTPIRG